MGCIQSLFHYGSYLVKEGTDQQTCKDEEIDEDDVSEELKNPETPESKDASPMPKETNATPSASALKENSHEIIQPLDKTQTIPTVTSTTVTIETRETLKKAQQPIVSSTTNRISLKQETSNEEPYLKASSTNEITFIKQDAPKEVTQPTTFPTTTETRFVRQEASKEVSQPIISPTTTETSFVKHEVSKEVSQPITFPTTEISLVRQEASKEQPHLTTSHTTTETSFVKKEVSKEVSQPMTSPTITDTRFSRQKVSKEVSQPMTFPTTTETSFVKQEASKEVSQPMISPTTTGTSFVKQEVSKEASQAITFPTTEISVVRQVALEEQPHLTTSHTTNETSFVKKEVLKEVSHPMTSPGTTETSFIKQEVSKEVSQRTISPTTTETNFVKQEISKEVSQPMISPTTTETSFVKQEVLKEVSQPMTSPTTTDISFVREEATTEEYKPIEISSIHEIPNDGATHTVMEENAAVKIQSAFRGYMTRKYYAAALAEDGDLVYPQTKQDNEDITKYELQKLTPTPKEENNVVEQKESLDGKLNLKKEEELTTEKCEQTDPEGSKSLKSTKRSPEEAEYDNQLKIEAGNKEFYLPDEKQQIAATRIQAVFRGYQVRREIKQGNVHIKCESTQDAERQGQNQSHEQLQYEAKTVSQTTVGDEKEKDYSQHEQHKDLQEEGDHRKIPQESLVSLEKKKSECLEKENKDVDHSSVTGLFRAEPVKILNFDESVRLLYPKVDDNKEECNQKCQEQSSFSADKRRRSAPVFGTPKFEENLNFPACLQKTQDKAEISFTFPEECAMLEDHRTVNSQKEISKELNVSDTQNEQVDFPLSDSSTFKQKLNQSQIIDVETSHPQHSVDHLNITDLSHSDVLLQSPEDLLTFHETQTSCTEPSEESMFQGHTSFIPQELSENDFFTFDKEVAPKNSWILDEKKEIAFLQNSDDLISLLEDSSGVQTKPETQTPAKKPEESIKLFYEDCHDSSCTIESDERHSMLKNNVIENLSFLETPNPSIKSNTQQEDTLIQLEEINLKGASSSQEDTFWPLVYETDKKELRTSAQTVDTRDTSLYCQNTVNNTDILKDIQQLAGETEISDGITKDKSNSLKFQVKSTDALVERQQTESVPDTTISTKSKNEQISEFSLLAESTGEQLREDILESELRGTSLLKDNSENKTFDKPNTLTSSLSDQQYTKQPNVVEKATVSKELQLESNVEN